MILVDPRRGSDKFGPIFRSFGIETRMEQMEYGDFFFIGNGPDGPETVTIGIEHKRLDDLIQCMHDKRFVGHQLPGLCSTYHLPILMIEGQFEPGQQGELKYLPFSGAGKYKGMQSYTYGNREMMYREVISHLSSLKYCAGLEIQRTRNVHESAFHIACEYRWWCGKEYNEHRSHLGNHLVTATVPDPRGTPLHLRLCRDMAMQLPGVGDKMSKLVTSHFQYAENMVNADVREWMAIDGIGKKTAQTIVAALKRNGASK